jgi:molybdenum cofactor cytidylyltransferase
MGSRRRWPRSARACPDAGEGRRRRGMPGLRERSGSMRIVRVLPGQPLPEPGDALDGAVLARDLDADGARWSKGRRLTPDDLSLLAAGEAHGRGSWAGLVGPVALLVPEFGDMHEDDAAVRLAVAVAGPGIEVRGPHESRVDLFAAAAGVLCVSAAYLERFNRIDGLNAFTLFDGQLVTAGTLVASVKTGPHLVPAADVVAGEAAAAAGWPLVDVRPYASRRIAAIVKESLAPAGRARFEAALDARVVGLGSTLTRLAYVEDDPAAAERAFRRFLRGPDRADVILTAGGASTDPTDAILVAFAAVGGKVVSHGVPAHPGSMLWLGRAGMTSVLGLPTCGAYSRATAADLVLPWLLAGAPPNRRTIARLGHGGMLTRDMRFRFPPYARPLDPPDA